MEPALLSSGMAGCCGVCSATEGWRGLVRAAGLTVAASKVTWREPVPLPPAAGVAVLLSKCRCLMALWPCCRLPREAAGRGLLPCPRFSFAGEKASFLTPVDLLVAAAAAAVPAAPTASAAASAPPGVLENLLGKRWALPVRPVVRGVKVLRAERGGCSAAPGAAAAAAGRYAGSPFSTPAVAKLHLH